MRKPFFGLMLTATLLSGVAGAETQEELMSSTAVASAVALMPDLAKMPLQFGKDLKWTEGGNKGYWSAPLFGDASKPGIYGVLIRWMPGASSQPHFHSQDRFAYVISGKWWVSDSPVYDKTKMYPVPAGSLVTHPKGLVHWDGNPAQSTEPALILLVGQGPMVTTRYVQKDPGNPLFSPPEAK